MARLETSTTEIFLNIYILASESTSRQRLAAAISSPGRTEAHHRSDRI